ncbi:MAG: hypothetical protein KGD58_09270 [Candidatus Lokiarchaeota archaeon]|nr:hypothetical protein [Candidatus Lokiarchaeota archaeon]
MEDLRDQLANISSAEDYELLSHCSFQSVREAQLKELKDLAITTYESFHGIDNFLEALDIEDKEEYRQLREEPYTYY